MEQKQNPNKVSKEVQLLSQEEQDIISKLYPICPTCSSNIEIISIDEIKTNEEINHTMKYRCIKENIINNISFKEYINLLKNKKEKNKEQLKDECEKHQSKKFISYCFDCDNHLCEDCLKTGIHLKHVKNNIIEVKPIEEELDIIRGVIDVYKLRLEKIKKEKENIKGKYKELIDKDKRKIEEKLDNIKEKNKIKKKIELDNNKRKYILDIDKLKKEYENKIRERKKEYIEENNKINNKYKLITEKSIINYKNKINELINYYEKEINKYKFEKKIENYENMMKMNIIIYGTYYNYNNNYYNSININSLLLYYINNNYINNNIVKNKLKDKYDDIINIINNRKERGYQIIEDLKNEINIIKNEVSVYF